MTAFSRWAAGKFKAYAKNFSSTLMLCQRRNSASASTAQGKSAQLKEQKHQRDR
jgi:hypothetical protein